MNCDNSNRSPVDRCLLVAGENLQKAIDQRQRQRRSNDSNWGDRFDVMDGGAAAAVENNDKSKTISSNDDSNSNETKKDINTDNYDPDDMAAAFFAQQHANKQREEENRNRKTFDEWAEIVLRKQEREQQRNNQRNNKGNGEGDEHITRNNSDFELALVDELIQEYRRIIHSPS